MKQDQGKRKHFQYLKHDCFQPEAGRQLPLPQQLPLESCCSKTFMVDLV